MPFHDNFYKKWVVKHLRKAKPKAKSSLKTLPVSFIPCPPWQRRWQLVPEIAAMEIWRKITKDGGFFIGG
jgi:hypothetical protein